MTRPTYTTVWLVLLVELGMLASTGASLYAISHTMDYEQLAEHADAVERARIPDYMTDRKGKQ